jgi:ankyrin repeat protein
MQDRLGAGDDIGLADTLGFTALLEAIADRRSQVLWKAGAPVDPRDRFGNRPLRRAVFKSPGQEATVEALLKAGADPDIVNETQ